MTVCKLLTSWCHSVHHCQALSPGQVQVEHLVRCAPSHYQQALFRIVQQQLKGGAAASQQRTIAVSNTVMELRNICNHPTIRLLLHWTSTWSSLQIHLRVCVDKQ